MYIAKHHRLPDPEAIFSLMETHPLGAWVCQTPGGLVANHVPFFLERHRGGSGTLIGHVARANPVWRELDTARPSVVMFQGPQGYMSPGWYPGKAAHGKVVPTWNYVVAHAHGMARAVREKAWLLAMLNRLTDTHEAGRPAPWRVRDAPASYIEQMLQRIVGIEIAVDRLEGKLKASQDENLQDRIGTLDALRQDGHDASQRMADLIQGTLDGARP